MLIVAFNFRGASQVAFHQHRAGIAAEGDGGGIKHRTARDHFLRLAYVGNNGLKRQTHAAGHASQAQRCAHYLEKAAARD